MGQYKRKDHFWKKAKEVGYVSRASFKLEQIQEKHKILKAGARVVDLGCAPGGWLQVASKIVGKNGFVYGIDILPTKVGNLQNTKIVLGDISDRGVITEMRKEIGAADAVISDMAPNTSGVKFKDAYLSYELALSALDVAKALLKEGGNFVAKVFPGEEFQKFKKELQKNFERVVQYRPEATRKTSNEIYLIGIKFLAPAGPESC